MDFLGSKLKLGIGECDYAPILGKVLSAMCPQVNIKTNCAMLVASLKLRKPDIGGVAKDIEYLMYMSRKRRNYKLGVRIAGVLNAPPSDNLLILDRLADPVQLNTLVIGMEEFLSKVNVATRKLGRGIREKKRRMLKENEELYSIKGGGTVKVKFGITPEKCESLAKRVKFLTVEFLKDKD